MTLKLLKLLKTTLLAACLGAGTAWAYDQPSVNMGGTSFFDGAPLPGGPASTSSNT